MRPTPADIRRKNTRYSERIMVNAWKKYFAEECNEDIEGFQQLMNHYIDRAVNENFDPSGPKSNYIVDAFSLRSYYVLQIYDILLLYPIFLARNPRLRACTLAKSETLKREIEDGLKSRQNSNNLFATKAYETIGVVQEMCRYLHLINGYKE